MTQETTRAFGSLIGRVAEELGLQAIAPLAGGEYGALLVADVAGAEWVLKAMASEEWAPVFARGGEMAERLRALGYPAPKYAGTGAAVGASWSMQERLPGAVPDVMTEAHASRLLELVAMHAGAAGRSMSWDRALARRRGWLDELSARPETATIAAELGAVLERAAGVPLLGDSVMHNDFHHRNYLADGDEVTGVFDWEMAWPGDWRFDLVTLAFWAVLLPEQIPAPAARLIVERMHAACPPDVLALLSALRATDQLDFDARVHPERLALVLPAIETQVAPWWRVVL